jgi:hypothetical protein
MANIIRSAKSGSDWTSNELMAYKYLDLACKYKEGEVSYVDNFAIRVRVQALNKSDHIRM